MKKRMLFLLLAFMLALQSMVLAAPVPLESPGEPLWRVDAPNEDGLPRNYRTMQDEFQNKKFKGTMPVRTGLADLKMSGSAMYSEKQFDSMIANIKNLHNGPIFMIDLRQESHGLVNGIAVSAYVDRNWINVGKSLSQVEKEEKAWLSSAVGQYAELAVLDDYKKASSITNTLIEKAITEQELVTSRGIGYFRLQSTDHSAFTDEQVDQFMKFYKSLPANAWVHFHCYAGEGRTTQIMVMYDILKNGKNVSFEDIANRQYLIGGNDALKVTASKERDAYKVPLFKEKVQMLKAFYQYVTTSPADLPMAFSEWRKNVYKGDAGE